MILSTSNDFLHRTLTFRGSSAVLVTTNAGSIPTSANSTTTPPKVKRQMLSTIRFSWLLSEFPADHGNWQAIRHFGCRNKASSGHLRLWCSPSTRNERSPKRRKFFLSHNYPLFWLLFTLHKAIKSKNFSIILLMVIFPQFLINLSRCSSFTACQDLIQTT